MSRGDTALSVSSASAGTATGYYSFVHAGAHVGSDA
jgi:hypothetical protein